MTETDPPTAETMELRGGHPALELVNTVYGQVGGPVEHDVLRTPGDLVTLTCRLGLAVADTPTSAGALAAARRIRDGVDVLLRAGLAGAEHPRAALVDVESSVRAAYAAARLEPASESGLGWVWSDGDAHTPVHRLSVAALDLLGDPVELARLRCCDACCWLYLDHSRGAGRRWCSMSGCGAEAKKRRYVVRRRERSRDT